MAASLSTLQEAPFWALPSSLITPRYSTRVERLENGGPSQINSGKNTFGRLASGIEAAVMSLGREEETREKQQGSLSPFGSSRLPHPHPNPLCRPAGKGRPAAKARAAGKTWWLPSRSGGGGGGGVTHSFVLPEASIPTVWPDWTTASSGSAHPFFFCWYTLEHNSWSLRIFLSLSHMHGHIFAPRLSDTRLDAKRLPAKHLPVAMAAEREGSRTSERAKRNESLLEPARCATFAAEILCVCAEVEGGECQFWRGMGVNGENRDSTLTCVSK